MSALANTSSSNDMKQNLIDNQSRLAESISDISVTTRIDYNLRFTKQAVFVVANNTEQYSQLASQFLVSLSNERANNNQVTPQDNHINVAFVSASTKINDIQIRCRLIEQLFVNTLFDPEESLAVSILRLAKLQSEPISIVIDHAQAVSLQVKYELSQLVSLAKKSKLIINVVLFGLTEAAQQLSENKSLFKAKMVLIDAESGQVLSFDDKKFAIDEKRRSVSLWQKIALFGAILLITSSLVWLYLLIIDDVNQQSKITNIQAIDINSSPGLFNSDAKIANAEVVGKMKKKEKTTLQENTQNTVEVKSATSKDVLQALLTDSRVKQVEPLQAKSGDVLKALVVADTTSEAEAKKLLYAKRISTIQQDKNEILQKGSHEINLNYYQAKSIEHKQGFVIQIAGFSDNDLSTRFIAENTSEALYSYQRYLADKDFTVVTSKVYANKAEAKAAISLLPVQLIERKPWLKPISSVINEINTFKR
jgi:DamX protein